MNISGCNAIIKCRNYLILNSTATHSVSEKQAV